MVVSRVPSPCVAEGPSLLRESGDRRGLCSALKPARSGQPAQTTQRRQGRQALDQSDAIAHIAGMPTGDAVAELAFDHILIDCPPSLNLLTVNAMVAAHSVLVPLQSEFFALEGLSQLMLTLREVRQSANPGLRIEGVVLTMFDARNNLSLQVEEDARKALGDLVFETRVPRNVRISEAPSYAQSVLDYDTRSKGSVAYRALAKEMLERNVGSIR